MALAGVATVIASAWLFDQLPPRSLLPLGATTAALFFYNLALSLDRGKSHTGFRHPASQIIVDCTALALLVHFSGGVENPFLSLFVLHVVNANIALRPRAATATLWLVIVLASVIVVGEGMGVLRHYCLRLDGAVCTSTSLNTHAAAVLAGLVLTLAAASAFSRFLTLRLLQSRRRLAANLETLSREKERLAFSQGEIELERARLHAIVNGMGEAVLFADGNGNVQLSNKSAQELRGARGWGSLSSPLSEQSLAARFLELRDQRAAHVESPLELEGRTLEATFSTVRSPRGEAIGLVVVMRDISKRLLLEKHFMHEERMNVVGKLAAAVAHEINNPIGVVSLYCQHALEKVDQDSPVRRNLEVIKRNADSCGRITEQLLELARPRRPERRRIDLRVLCSELLDSVRPLADKGGVTLRSEALGHDVPLWTQCDAEQIRQALLNLALNAVEALPSGGEVRIRAYETQDGGTTAHVVEVSDNGPGIAKEHLDRVFQPFFSTKDAGTGLGLSVADNIVKSHAGRMTVESRPNSGTTFRIFLPATSDADTRATEVET